MLRIERKHLQINIDDQGFIQISNQLTNSTTPASPIGYVLMNNAFFPPISAVIEQGRIHLAYENATATLQVTAQESYIKLDVLAISDTVEGWIWGPYEIGYSGYGEIIGTAWNDDYAIGLQALNPKTEGGFPYEMEARHPLIQTIVDRSGERETISRCAALPLIQGTALQAFARNRTRETKRDYFYAKDALVLPVEGPDALITGSSIALFGCEKKEILNTIAKIEVAENLPHPTPDGIWNKQNPKVNSAYFVASFTESTIDSALDYTEAMGLDCLYHPAPFENWGHFEFSRDSFPNGTAGMKACVQKAEKRGIHIGVHSLSNFMTTNDPFVTPIPSKHILKMGETTLLQTLDEKNTEIYIEDASFFTRLSTLNAVRIEDELLKYESVSPTAQGYLLHGCERGAWGTTAASHTNGLAVARLWDYNYKTLFPDIVLQREFSKNLARQVKETGIKRISFDGLSAEYSGHGDYANALFVKDCYDIWGSDMRSDASGLTHYDWHMHSYMNWGEPWYTDMRSGMHGYREENQRYFARNHLAPMMGWYTMRLATQKHEATTPDDIEWMLSNAAGNKAGFAFSVGLDVLENHGKTDDYLQLVALWEDMRLNGNIPDKIAAELRDSKTEWHIEAHAEGWTLYRLNIAQSESSPEESKRDETADNAYMPIENAFMNYNPYDEQALVFRVRVGDSRDDGFINKLRIRTGENTLAFDLRVAAGHYILYEGGDEIRICGPDFNEIQTVKGEGTSLKLKHGIDMVYFSCGFEGERLPYPLAKLFMKDKGTIISRK